MAAEVVTRDDVNAYDRACGSTRLCRPGECSPGDVIRAEAYRFVEGRRAEVEASRQEIEAQVAKLRGEMRAHRRQHGTEIAKAEREASQRERLLSVLNGARPDWTVTGTVLDFNKKVIVVDLSRGAAYSGSQGVLLPLPRCAGILGWTKKMVHMNAVIAERIYRIGATQPLAQSAYGQPIHCEMFTVKITKAFKRQLRKTRKMLEKVTDLPKSVRQLQMMQSRLGDLEAKLAEINRGLTALHNYRNKLGCNSVKQTCRRWPERAGWRNRF